MSLFCVRNDFTFLAKFSENHVLLLHFSNLKKTKLIFSKILAQIQWAVVDTILTVLVMRDCFLKLLDKEAGDGWSMCGLLLTQQWILKSKLPCM